MSPLYNSLAASLFLLILAQLSWYAILAWQQSRHLFYALLCFFLFACAIIGTPVITLSNQGWIIGGIACVLGIGYWFMLRRAIRLSPGTSKQLVRLLIWGLILATLVNGGPYLTRQYYQRQRSDQLIIATTNQKSALLRRADQLGSLATALTDAADFTSNWKDQNQSATISALEQYRLSNQLDFITLTSDQGTVQLRSQQPDRLGDNLLQQLPWLAPLYASSGPSGLQGVAFDESNQPVVLAGLRFQLDSLHGVIMLGNYLDTSYWQRSFDTAGGGRAIGLTDQNGIVSDFADGTSLRQVVEAADFSTYLNQQMVNRAIPSSALVTAGGTNYLVAQSLVPSLDQTRSISLITLEDEGSH